MILWTDTQTQGRIATSACHFDQASQQRTPYAVGPKSLLHRHRNLRNIRTHKTVRVLLNCPKPKPGCANGHTLLLGYQAPVARATAPPVQKLAKLTLNRKNSKRGTRNC